MTKQGHLAVKLIVIGLIIGFLLILNTCISNKLRDREMTRNEAVGEINRAAGGTFTVNDIFIGIPYTCRTVEKDEKGIEKTILSEGVEYYQPESVDYEADLITEKRNIGIYESPVFTADLKINCSFNFDYPVNTTKYTYKTNQAFIKVKTDDTNIISQPAFNINGSNYKTTFTGSSQDKLGLTSYFKCNSGKIDFSTDLKIRGAGTFDICLCSQQTNLSAKSDWSSPAFKDFTYLPTVYDISKEGFTAKWNIPFDAGNAGHTIGFKYVYPVDIYKMIHRAVTYSFLFIIVPFIIMFLFEIFLSVNLHPLHYLLCGAASVIFFLLLLSVSEHISFVLAYILSAAASGLLISIYISSVTKMKRVGGIMSLVFLLMYGFLYLSLKSEDYALLIGSLFAFIVLASVMFFTRKVNWSDLKKINELHSDTAAEAVSTEQI